MIPDAVIALVYNSALGDARADRNSDRRAVYDRLLNQYGFATIAERQQLRRIVDQAFNSNATARYIDGLDENRRPTRRDHTIDPTCQGGYCYRLVVVLRDADGNQWETAINVNSASPLTRAEMLAQAAAVVVNLQRPLESRRANDRRSPDSVVVEVHVVSAGRQR